MKKFFGLTAMFMCFTCFLFAERIPEGYIEEFWYFGSYKDGGQKIKCDGIYENCFMYQILDPESVSKTTVVGVEEEPKWLMKRGEKEILLSCKEIYKEKCIRIFGIIVDKEITEELKIPEQIDGYKVIDCSLDTYCEKRGNAIKGDPYGRFKKVIIPDSVIYFYDNINNSKQPPKPFIEQIIFLRNRNELMYLCGESSDLSNYYYLNDGELFPLSKGNIIFDIQTDCCIVGKNWKGTITPYNRSTFRIEEGIEEINNIEFLWNPEDAYSLKLFFPNSLKEFNGSISTLERYSFGAVDIVISEGSNIKFSPGFIKIYVWNDEDEKNLETVPVTLANYEEVRLDRSFIDYLIKQNYQFDKE